MEAVDLGLVVTGLEVVLEKMGLNWEDSMIDLVGLVAVPTQTFTRSEIEDKLKSVDVRDDLNGFSCTLVCKKKVRQHTWSRGGPELVQSGISTLTSASSRG